jgi:hypothetical protein
MKKYLTLPVLAVLGSTMMLSFFATSLAFAQDTPYDEEYMAQHDGGDRDEYLQEMEHSDPRLYVPPANDANHSTINNNSTTD